MTAANRILNETVPRAVIAALTASDRVTPMLAGASCIRQDGDQGVLVVRTPETEVEVAASAALLDRVFTLCDGSLTVDEVLARIDDVAERAEFGSFLGFLFEQGALIDGNLACAQAVGYGHQLSQVGVAAPPALSDLIAPRFRWNLENVPKALPTGTVRVASAPLDGFFEDRASLYTFNDKPVSESALHKLLWSAAGVVHATHPRSGPVIAHRTLASAGGMHLLKVFVALRRQVGRYAPGVYRVEYPGERLLALTCVNEDVSTLPLAHTKPWQLESAAGVIFIAADPSIAAARYRNRSMQYLFMEAGAALHNLALTAPALGLAQATLGGFYERPATELCRLGEREIVLGTSMFGVKPTQRQLDRADDSPTFAFGWVGAQAPHFQMSFHLARAKIIDDHDERQFTWGRDTDPMLAVRKAMAEAVEREGYCQPRDLLTGRLDQVRHAIDPAPHAFYTDLQYRSPGFAFAPFDAEQPHAWVPARELATGRKVHVLADLVFARTALRQAGAAVERPFTQESSSGCAAGLDLEDATLRALREVIERDAFMRHWLAQRPGQVVPSSQWPRAIRERMARLEAAGCKVLLQRLDSPWLPVAMVSVQHEEAHFTTVGAGAHPDFAVGACSALDETESRVYAWLHGQAPNGVPPEAAATPEDHFCLYGMAEHFRKADRVLFPEAATQTATWPRKLSNDTLEKLVGRLTRGGLSAYGVDITPRKHHLDQGRTPLRVARVLVPGLVPLSFGYGREPLRLVDKVHPDASFPHPFP